MSFLFNNKGSKTFKPKKNIPDGPHQANLTKWDMKERILYFKMVCFAGTQQLL